ncbi:MAG: nicotinate-nucleotide adenylyltransferase [Dehalococcoidales bacterium]|nr:nicotinate-nucleotide adenylyltransferase [Dehalococcoidales bacterium]
MNIGVLGGTFDPIHNGHLRIASEVKARLKLAEIWLVPAACPQLKPASPISAEHRLHMVQLAITDIPYCRLSTLEIARGGASYTVDTITELRLKLGPGDELFFILGWDNLAQLPRWHEPSQLVKMCHLVVVPRPGYTLPNVELLEAAVPGLARSIILLDLPWIDISASEVRNRVAQGLSIEHLVPEVVARYIRENGLYTGSR